LDRVRLQSLLHPDLLGLVRGAALKGGHLRVGRLQSKVDLGSVSRVEGDDGRVLVVRALQHGSVGAVLWSLGLVVAVLGQRTLRSEPRLRLLEDRVPLLLIQHCLLQLLFG